MSQSSFYNMVQVYTATTGTGTVTLGAAVSSYLSFSGAGIPNGATISYVITDGVQRECGQGVYSSAGPTLTRATIFSSTNGGAAITLDGAAIVSVDALANDLVSLSAANTWTASQTFANTTTIGNPTAQGLLNINASSTSYIAAINFESAGTAYWYIGMPTGSNAPWQVFSYYINGSVFSLNYTTGAATFYAGITGSGTLTMSGTGQQTLSLQSAGNGTLQANILTGVATISNSGTGNFNFNVTTGASFNWFVNTVQVGGISTAGYTFPDSTVQATAANSVGVRQTAIHGDNANGVPSFMTTGSGLTPAYTATVPLLLTFANGFGAGGDADLVTTLSSGGSMAAVMANTTGFEYCTYSSATAVTWGFTLAPPQYGSTYNQAAQSSLTLNNSNLDDFGSTWVNTGVTFSNTSPKITGTYYGVFNGSSSKMVTNAINALASSNNGAFTIRAWANPSSFSTYTPIWGNSTTGYGALVGINTSGKSLLYLSSVGASWDIAIGTTGTATIATGTWYLIELTFDPVAFKYYLYVNGTLDQTISSAVKASAPFNGLQVGACAVANFFAGNIQGFEYMPYCLHPAGTTYSVPTALGSFNDGVPLNDWFDTTNYVMKTPSAASGSVGTNPTFTTSKKLYVGEAYAGASTLSFVSAYAFNGAYDSGWITPLPGVATVVSKNSYMGVVPNAFTLTFKNLAGDSGFNPGDISSNWASSAGGVLVAVTVNVGKNVIGYTTGSSTAWFAINKTTGAIFTPTSANWAYRLTANRGF